MARAALVLGGGGITGAAWEIGMLAGLHAAGVDLTSADAVIGTSAGAIVGAQILSGVPIDELYSRQFRDPIGEVATHVPISTLGRFLIWTLMSGDERQVRARIGRAALRAHTMPESERKRVISGRLHSTSWPKRDLRITAIDAESGEFLVFKRDSGVDLVDAVAASCAVPLVYPPATIGARRFDRARPLKVRSNCWAKTFGRWSSKPTRTPERRWERSPSTPRFAPRRLVRD